MKKQNLLVALFTLFVMSLIITGCSKQPAAVKGEDTLSGTITVSGAFALYPMMGRWGEEFNKLHPQVKFDVSAGGAGKGMTDALAGAVEIGMVSREIRPEEVKKGAFWVSVTEDAVFMVVNEKNPVWEDLYKKGVTKETLIGIYITGKITTWGQVVGRPEVTEPIHVFTRSDSAGAPEVWSGYLGKKQEDLKGIGVSGDPGLLEAVVKDPMGIGYNNLGYAFDLSTGKPVAGARVVPLDVNGNGQADPEEIYDTQKQAINAVATGKYPSPPARNLNLVTKGKPSGVVKDFISWILTDGQKYVNEAGYIPLSAELLKSELKKLE